MIGTPHPDLWQAEGAMSRLPRFLTVFAERRTWGELLFALLGLPLGVAGFTFTTVTFTVSAGLLITFVGLPLMAVTGLISRYLGYGLRALTNKLTGTHVPAPQPFHARPGLLGWIGSCMTDGTGWRARLYLLLKLPLGILTFTTALFMWVYGVGGLTYATWRPALGCNRTSDGRCHHAIGFTDSWQADTPFRIFLVSVAGLILLLAAPWVVRGVVSLDRLAVRSLLGPTASAERLAQLERTRAVAVDDSAATLRRIERDLHDGAQAKLVAVAMNVGLAREKLAEGGDANDANRLLDAAHATAKEAIVELRDLARGIHPPVLDAGLDAALATLVSHGAVPVTLTTAIDQRPEPAIETMAYFCAAELLTNVAKHSGARHAWLDVRTFDGRLWLRVSDDGRGGARVGAGTGLRGLAERVGTVDGRLTVESPAGGPTAVTVDVPLRAGGAA
jgi:signal transduction histidine kinase